MAVFTSPTISDAPKPAAMSQISQVIELSADQLDAYFDAWRATDPDSIFHHATQSIDLPSVSLKLEVVADYYARLPMSWFLYSGESFCQSLEGWIAAEIKEMKEDEIKEFKVASEKENKTLQLTVEFNYKAETKDYYGDISMSASHKPFMVLLKKVMVANAVFNKPVTWSEFNLENNAHLTTVDQSKAASKEEVSKDKAKPEAKKAAAKEVVVSKEGKTDEEKAVVTADEKTEEVNPKSQEAEQEKNAELENEKDHPDEGDNLTANNMNALVASTVNLVIGELAENYTLHNELSQLVEPQFAYVYFSMASYSSNYIWARSKDRSILEDIDYRFLKSHPDQFTSSTIEELHLSPKDSFFEICFYPLNKVLFPDAPRVNALLKNILLETLGFDRVDNHIGGYQRARRRD